MRSNVTRIKSDGVFVTLPSDVQMELVELCKMHGVCPEWMGEGLSEKVELNQYEKLRLLLRVNGEQDLPSLVAFIIGTNSATETDATWNDVGMVAAGYASGAPGDGVSPQPSHVP